jgi:microcystin-dependent protein
METFLGMIAMFGFNFNPKGWAFCNGQLISIQQNSALFSLLGTQYGGNGTTNFALPNLQSRVPIGMGTGPGLSNYVIGQTGGEENHTLLINEMPQHNHLMTGSGEAAAQNSPAGGSLPSTARGVNSYTTGGNSLSPMASATVVTGGNQGHNNIQPYLAINYCIALQGIFPSRN